MNCSVGIKYQNSWLSQTSVLSGASVTSLGPGVYRFTLALDVEASGTGYYQVVSSLTIGAFSLGSGPVQGSSTTSGTGAGTTVVALVAGSTSITLDTTLTSGGATLTGYNVYVTIEQVQ